MKKFSSSLLSISFVVSTFLLGTLFTPANAMLHRKKQGKNEQAHESKEAEDAAAEASSLEAEQRAIIQAIPAAELAQERTPEILTLADQLLTCPAKGSFLFYMVTNLSNSASSLCGCIDRLEILLKEVARGNFSVSEKEKAQEYLNKIAKLKKQRDAAINELQPSPPDCILVLADSDQYSEDEDKQTNRNAKASMGYFLKKNPEIAQALENYENATNSQ
jgi:hypothetical protein